jgi:hypothetical protein
MKSLRLYNESADQAEAYNPVNLDGRRTIKPVLGCIHLELLAAAVPGVPAN